MHIKNFGTHIIADRQSFSIWTFGETCFCQKWVFNGNGLKWCFFREIMDNPEATLEIAKENQLANAN